MSRSLFPANTLIALALGLALHGTAVAQDHRGHTVPTPAPVAKGHTDHAPPTVKAPEAAADEHAGHVGHGSAAPAKPAPKTGPKTTTDSPKPMDHAAMGHGAMDQVATDHDGMDHSMHNVAPAAPAEPADHAGMDHGSMDHGAMDHGAMDHAAMGHGAAPARTEPITPIPTVTDADRAAAFPVLHRPMQHAPEINSYVAFNRLETWDAKPGSGQAWEVQAWVGSDLNRLWLRSEGERTGGKTEAADLEVLYGRSVSTWWDVLAGIKHDFSPGGSQSWAAFGVQGFAPYKFDVKATAYVGESGRTAANVELEYELLLTNRLILQPLIEVTAFGKDDRERGIGSGLSSVEAGVRLRYEISRKFAPYVGVVHERAFGNTADFRRAEGEDTRDTRVVAGVRIWF